MPLLKTMSMRATLYQKVFLLGKPVLLLTFSIGAVVIGNTWCAVFLLRSRVILTASRAILHDPDVYPEPDTFKPERFLNRDGTLRDDPFLMSAFGYGKRICPGRHFASDTLFIVVASVLSVFNFRRPDSESGTSACSYIDYGSATRYLTFTVPCQ